MGASPSGLPEYDMKLNRATASPSALRKIQMHPAVISASLISVAHRLARKRFFGGWRRARADFRAPKPLWRFIQPVFEYPEGGATGTNPWRHTIDAAARRRINGLSQDCPQSPIGLRPAAGKKNVRK
jgi:hypothetical protein